MAVELEGVVAAIRKAHAAPLPFVPQPQALAGAPCTRTIAVDGSNATLIQNGALWVVLTRAAALAWPGSPQAESPMQIHAVVPKDAVAALELKASALGVKAPSRVPSADAWAVALRELEELETTLACLQTMAPGELLLVDGALHGLPERQQEMADRILRSAERRGVAVAGVAKRSGLSMDGVPVVPRVATAVSDAGPWRVAVPGRDGIWVAKLHSSAPWVFRVDGAPEALEMLVPLARDAAYLGYPYPLAAAHNAVAITRDHALGAKAQLEDALRAAGLDGPWWQDFHDELDRNVPG